MEIAPIVEKFSETLSTFSGLGLNEIRYLGNHKLESVSTSDDGKNLIIDGETIPATPADVLAYIKAQKENHKEQLKEADATLVANKKVLADKEELINKYAKNVSRLEGAIKELGLSPEEGGFLKEMDNIRVSFDGYLLNLDPDRIYNIFGDSERELTPRMRAAYLSSLDYMKKQVLMAFDRGETIFGSAVMTPDVFFPQGYEFGQATLELIKNTKLPGSENES